MRDRSWECTPHFLSLPAMRSAAECTHSANFRVICSPAHAEHDRVILASGQNVCGCIIMAKAQPGACRARQSHSGQRSECMWVHHYGKSVSRTFLRFSSSRHGTRWNCLQLSSGPTGFQSDKIQEKQNPFLLSDHEFQTRTRDHRFISNDFKLPAKLS